MEKRDYEIIYPLEYYGKESKKGHLYGLIDQETNQLVYWAVLLEEDACWKDKANAIIFIIWLLILIKKEQENYSFLI